MRARAIKHDESCLICQELYNPYKKRINEVFKARLRKIFNQQWERRFPMSDYESRKVIFHEILLFAITPDYQCFTKLPSSLNLKNTPN